MEDRVISHARVAIIDYLYRMGVEHTERMKTMRVLMIIGLTLLVAACAPTTKRPEVSSSAVSAEAQRQKDMVVRDYMDKTDRLAVTAFQIQKSNAGLCPEKRYVAGFDARTLSEVSKTYRESWRRVMKLDERVRVIQVIEGSPAEKAGVKVGDILLERNGEKIDDPLPLEHSDTMNLKVSREGEDHTFRIQKQITCDYPAIPQSSSEINAYADGEKIIVTTAMMDFVKNDDELALIVAHEMAHNTMDHIKKKKGNVLIAGVVGAIISGLSGVPMDLSQAGANAYSQAFEAEADYVGVYYAARAGYDVSRAADLWRRLAAYHPQAIHVSSGTHPSTAERFTALEATIAEVQRKQAAGEPLIPEIEGWAAPVSGTPGTSSAQTPFGGD